MFQLCFDTKYGSAERHVRIFRELQGKEQVRGSLYKPVFLKKLQQSETIFPRTSLM